MLLVLVFNGSVDVSICVFALCLYCCFVGF